MGHRFSKPQRQLPTDSQTSPAATPHSHNQPARPRAEPQATPHATLQQVSAIVITICMLKVDEPAAGIDPVGADGGAPTADAMPSGSCARHADADNGRCSGCAACGHLQQLQLSLSLDNRCDGLLADRSTSAASTAARAAVVAVHHPPLISMRDIAGDSADDDEDDCDDNAAASSPNDKLNNNRAADTMPPTASSVDNNANSGATPMRRIDANATNYKKTVLLAAQAATTSHNCGESAWQQQQQQQQQLGNGNGNSESVGTSLAATDQRTDGNSSGSSAKLGASLSGSSSSSLAGAAAASTCVECQRQSAPQHRKKSPSTAATTCVSCGRPRPVAAASIGKPKTKNTWKLNCAKLITGKASASGSCGSNSNTSPHSTATIFNVSAASCATIAGATVGSASNVVQSSSPVALDNSTACVGTSYRRMDERDLIAAAVPAATARGSADIYLLPSTQQQQQHSAAAYGTSRHRSPANDDNDDYNNDHHHHQQQQAAGTDNLPHHSVATTATACATAAVQQMLLQSLHSGVGPPPSPAVQSSPSGGGNPQLGNAAMGGIVIHSQVDYVHCLVPDLQRITASAFYWGKMDRYEAERLLDGKPEGTFLLRDSAQEEFLFSVSFRKYARSLHARIEQFNHKFSFDCHDPGVFTSGSVTGLLEHYKDPACVMFFEPALTLPLTRNYCFTLQELCRAAIVSRTSFDGVAELQLPVTLRTYLREYHYRKRVRVQRFDEPLAAAAYEATTSQPAVGDAAAAGQPLMPVEQLDAGSGS